LLALAFKKAFFVIFVPFVFFVLLLRRRGLIQF
jgi:hypothetical protein